MARRAAAPGRAWLALAALLGLGSLLAWPLPREALDWQPALAESQPWRGLSAAFVHWSTLHLGANLLGLALVAALGRAAPCDRRAALAWVLAWPLTHLALLAQPTLAHYGGLSGVLHAGVAVAAWQLLRDGPDRRRRAIGAALLAGLALKLGLEAPWQGPLRQVPGWDIALAPGAHLAGTLAGLGCAVLVRIGTVARRTARGAGPA